MWHAPEGQTTFSGPFAAALAHCIWNMTSELEANLDEPDVCMHGTGSPDRLVGRVFQMKHRH